MIKHTINESQRQEEKLLKPLTHLSIDISLRHQSQFYGSTLNSYYWKRRSVSDLIVVKSSRLRIDLNFYIIILRQLKCSALHFRCGKVNYFGMLEFFKIYDFKRIYSRKNNKSVRDLRTINLNVKD
jgi:hypothetical protein